jgi:hypothetical protein
MWPGDEGGSTCLLQNKVKSYLDVGYDIKVDEGNFSKPCGYVRDVYNGLFTLVLCS